MLHESSSSYLRGRVALIVILVLIASMAWLSHSIHTIAKELNPEADTTTTIERTLWVPWNNGQKVQPTSSDNTIQGSAAVSRCSGLAPDYPFLPYDSFLRSVVVTPQYAYVTFITDASLVQPAATLMYSIAASGSIHSRCILVTDDVPVADQRYLALFAQVITIDHIASPLNVSNAQYKATFTKLRIWELEMLYTKVLYVDADVIILKNVDDLFDIPVGEFGIDWAAPLDGLVPRFSTGMMLIKPSLETFKQMMVSLKKDTTKAMMALPDLLFLNNFFSKVVPTKKPDTNLTVGNSVVISRWCQVYQSQIFSIRKPMGSYLEAREAQKITIFDNRIQGIHYPNKVKPWGPENAPFTEFRGMDDVALAFSFRYNKSFLRKLRAYSTAFCAWKDYVRYFSAHLNTHREHEYNIRKLARLQREIVVPAAAELSSSYSYSKEEARQRVEQFESDAFFWWFLKYYEMTHSLNSTLALRAGESDVTLNSHETGSQFNETIRMTSPAKVLAGFKKTKGKDLAFVMNVDYRAVQFANDTDFVFRTQLSLGSAWGFSPEYRRRKQESDAQHTYFSPLKLYGDTLSSLVGSWRSRRNSLKRNALTS